MEQFDITLTEADLAVLDQILGEQKYRIAAPLIDKINAAIERQRKAKENPDGHES